MWAKYPALACVASVLALFAVSSTAAAETATVPAMWFVSDTIHATEGDTISISWSADDPLVFTMTDPEGHSLVTATDDSDVRLVDATVTGYYTMIWTNTGLSAVSLTYNVDTIPFGNVQETMSDLALFGIIAAVGVGAVVVIIIVVVVYGGKKTPSPPVQHGYVPPPSGAAPFPPGTCPSCGSALDPAGQFCQRCGAKVR